MNEDGTKRVHWREVSGRPTLDNLQQALRVALWVMEEMTDQYTDGRELPIFYNFTNVETDTDFVWDLSGRETPPFDGWQRCVDEKTGEPDPDADDEWVIGADEFNRRWKETLDALREATK